MSCWDYKRRKQPPLILSHYPLCQEHSDLRVENTALEHWLAHLYRYWHKLDEQEKCRALARELVTNHSLFPAWGVDKYAMASSEVNLTPLTLLPTNLSQVFYWVEGLYENLMKTRSFSLEIYTCADTQFYMQFQGIHWSLKLTHRLQVKNLCSLGQSGFCVTPYAMQYQGHNIYLWKKKKKNFSNLNQIQPLNLTSSLHHEEETRQISVANSPGKSVQSQSLQQVNVMRDD